MSAAMDAAAAEEAVGLSIVIDSHTSTTLLPSAASEDTPPMVKLSFRGS